MSSANKNSEMPSHTTHANKSMNSNVAASGRAIAPKLNNQVFSMKNLHLHGESAGCVASFAVKVVALETVRRFSNAKCPLIWSSVQALQVLGYPPFRWIQRWVPLKCVVDAIQNISMPLLFISVTTSLGNRSSKKHVASISDGGNEPQTSAESPEIVSPVNTGIADDLDNKEETWVLQLFKELDKQGIALPERFSQDELSRFHDAVNGDLPRLILSLKKTICWRKTFRILSLQELEKWSHLVFWHGFDRMLRPCLIVRLGLAISILAPSDRLQFGQAIVSQIDHGILHLSSEEDPRVTVVLDCLGVSAFKLPMQLMRTFTSTLQENYPNRLATLLIVRLPPALRVMAQTVVQILNPRTKQKLQFEGDTYQKALTEFLQIVPAFLGGDCNCSRCGKPRRDPAGLTVDGSVTQPGATSYMHYDDNDLVQVQTDRCKNALRAALVCLLLVLIGIAVHAGMNDPESLHSHST